MIQSFGWTLRSGPFLQLLYLAAATILALLLRWRGRSPASTLGKLVRGWLPVLVAWIGMLVIALCGAAHLGAPYGFENNLYLLSSAALVALPTAALPTRFRAFGAFALLLAVAVVALGDAFYMRAFSGILSLEAAGGAGLLPDVTRSIAALFRRNDLWVFATPAGALVFAVLAWMRPEIPSPRVRWTIAAGALSFLLAVPAVCVLGGEKTSVRGHPMALSDGGLLKENGLIGAHLLSVARYVRDEFDSSESPEETARAQAYFGRVRSAPDPDFFGAASGKNLFLVQVEALQQWAVGLVIDGQQVTPFLDSVRDRALTFTQVYDQSKDGRTSDAEFAVLNSLHPLARGPVAFRRSGNHFLALPSVLKAHGYATLSAHVNAPGFWNRGVLHPEYGFDQMLFRKELGPGKILGWGLTDADLFERVVEKAPKNQPFAAFIITATSHHPFNYLPKEMEELKLGELEGTQLGNYLQSVRYVDGALRHLFDQLRERGLLDSTVVAIYGDHDAGLEYTEALKNLAGLSNWTDVTRVHFDRVPLMIWLPKASRTGQVDQPGGHVDIAPTLLRLLGVTTPRCFAGRALPSAKPAPVYSPMGAAISGDRMVLLDSRRCVRLPDGAPVVGESCDFADAAVIPVIASRYLTRHDAYRELNCDETPTEEPSTLRSPAVVSGPPPKEDQAHVTAAP